MHAHGPADASAACLDSALPVCHAACHAGDGGAAEDQHWAVLKLAWGVLLSQYGPDTAAGKHELFAW